MSSYWCAPPSFSDRVLLAVLLGLSACSGSSLHMVTTDASTGANVADGESPGPEGSPQADATIPDIPPVNVSFDAAQSNQSPDLVQSSEDSSTATGADATGQQGTGGTGGTGTSYQGNGGVSGTGGGFGSGGTGGTGGQPSSYCTVDGNLFDGGGINPTNPCQICDPQASASAWSSRDGVACDDGLFCTGLDTCHAGTCSHHAGSPCVDDGLFCDGIESCDEATHHCISSGNPCPDDGDPCNGPETCSESAKQCQHDGISNDCGTWVCGASPTGCFNCGNCSAGLVCVSGQCGCTPQTSTEPAASPPLIPAGLKVECLADPDDFTVAAECPVIKCGTITYWAFSSSDNADSMTVVGYDASGTAVHQTSLTGARYIYKIDVDSAAQTVTLVGQGRQTIVMPWSDLWQ